VNIDLLEKDGGTELALTHQRFLSDEIKRQHESGWGATLGRLQTLVSALSRNAAASRPDSL
jgi:hypothetical protein